jgi:hypothetical protein
MDKKRVDDFFKELFALYEKYDISIAHEDYYGGFELEKNCLFNREWISAANTDKLDELDDLEKE